MIDEDAAHGRGCRGHEMRTRIYGDVASALQPQVSLADQRRRLQRVTRRFLAHVGRGELAQICVEHREQTLESLVVASLPVSQQACNLLVFIPLVRVDVGLVGDETPLGALLRFFAL